MPIVIPPPWNPSTWAEMGREGSRRFLDALYAELGGEAQAAAANCDFRRISAKYGWHRLPSHAQAPERASVERWDNACDRAAAAVFSHWPNLEGGVPFDVTFLPTYRVRVRRELLAGATRDGAQLNIPCAEYVVDHDTASPTGSLTFRDADSRERGGDLILELDDYVDLAAFPNELAGTPLELIERLY